MPKKYPPYIIDKAIELRQKNKTIDEISEMLNVPRSTINGWVKDHPLTQRTNRQTEAQRNGTRVMQAKYKKMRDEAYDIGMTEASELFKDPFFRDFVTMYIAEGYKKTRHEVCIGNSDPIVLQMSQPYLIKFGNLDNKMEYRIQYHVDQDIDELITFWANTLNINSDDISLQRKSNSNQLEGRSWNSRYGVMTIRINDTYFRARLQAWIDYLKKEWVDKFGN